MKYQGTPLRTDRPMTRTTSVIASPEMQRPGSVMTRTSFGKRSASPRDTTRQNANGMNVSAMLPPTGPRAAADVVDYAATLLRVRLAADERQKCVDYLNTSVSGTAAAPVATPSTFDASSQSHLDTRLRGLLYVLTQHPSYEIR